MLEAKPIRQSILQSCSLLFLAIGGIIVNIVEVIVVGMVLVGIAMLTAYNIQCFREYSVLLTPLLYTVIFLVIGLPGFFIVFFMSRLMERNRSLGAIVLAVTGAFVWLGFSALIMAWHGEPNNWTILLGLISNVVGQVWAVLIMCRQNKDSLTCP